MSTTNKMPRQYHVSLLMGDTLHDQTVAYCTRVGTRRRQIYLIMLVCYALFFLPSLLYLFGVKMSDTLGLLVGFAYSTGMLLGLLFYCPFGESPS